MNRSSDDHSPGYDRNFYDRNASSRIIETQETTQYSTIRRPNANYHASNDVVRGRARDRHLYCRNGLYTSSSSSTIGVDR